MRILKKQISMVLSLIMIFGLSTNVSAASVSPSRTVKPISDIGAYDYKDVYLYIAQSKADVVLEINGVNIHYFYGDGYTVYEENGKYYLVSYGSDYKEVTMNGYPLNVEVVGRSDSSPQTLDLFRGAAKSAVAYASSRTYLFTDKVSISVGGLTVTAAMALFPAANLTAFAIKQVTSFITKKAVDGFLPNNFALTLRDDWYYTSLDPWMGTVDYSHDYSAWWGYTTNPYMEHITGDYYTGTIVERLA